MPSVPAYGRVPRCSQRKLVLKLFLRYLLMTRTLTKTIAGFKRTILVNDGLKRGSKSFF